MPKSQALPNARDIVFVGLWCFGTSVILVTAIFLLFQQELY